MGGSFHIGMKREMTITTQPEQTARVFYHNLPDVFATPFLAGCMERVSAELMDDCLQPGEQSVGGSMHLQHTAPTPLGMRVSVTTELVAIDGAKLTFKLEARDEAEKIGEAVHERYVIKAEKFNAKVAAKAKTIQ